MKKVRFEHIKITNFCGIKQFDSALHDRTIVKGKNAVGKSTVKKAIQYVLNVRDENGKEISGIRPHDENGVDIDGFTTSVELTVSVDGVENTLRKDFYQKKNRKGEYNGDDATEYFIDDVKKSTKKAYDEFVQTIMPNEACINANVLLEKDIAGRRAMLSAFSKHTTDDIIASSPLFEPIAGKVKANSIADLKKALREKINGSKNKSGLNDELKRIGVQIEVEESKKRDIDVAELELHRNAIKEQIAEIEAKEADISKQFEELQKLSYGVLELKFAESDLVRKANDDIDTKRRALNLQIGSLQSRLAEVERQININNQDIETAQKSIERNTILINAMRDNWTSTNKRVFDENSLICSYCGQEYPADKKEQLRAEFDTHKKEELADITVRGNELKSAIDKDKTEIEKIKAILTENETLKIELETQISKLETQYKGLPQSIDISDTEEYKAIQSQIAEKEAAMKKMSNAETIRQGLKDKKSELQSQLTKVNIQIALSEENVKIDEHIAELQKKQRDVSQQIADIESELDLINDFERNTAETLEKDVNEYFEFATVKMFDEYKDGSLKDICEFYVDGTPYSKGLNYSNRLLVEVDIAMAFQKKYDICAPILLDNAESIDSERIPNIENQLIAFQRTDDDKLIIENNENQTFVHIKPSNLSKGVC